MEEDKINYAFLVAVNAPSMGHCDSVVKVAMDRYWKSKKRYGGPQVQHTNILRNTRIYLEKRKYT